MSDQVNLDMLEAERAKWGGEMPLRCEVIDALIEETRALRRLKHLASSETDISIERIVDSALGRPTLAAALSIVAIWESERAVRQAIRNTIDDTRDAEVRRWDTCFEAAFTRLLDNWTERHGAFMDRTGAPPIPDHSNPERPVFARALESLINSYSIENGSNTPDFILASLLMQTLKTWELHTVERDRWWGNRSLLGVGSGGDAERTIDGAVPTSEKTLLPGVDITNPRDLIGEALGRVPGMSDYRFTEPPSAGPGNVGHQGDEGEPSRKSQRLYTMVLDSSDLAKSRERWSAQPLKPLDIPTGLTGAVNNLYCFHEKFGMPWITDEPTWPGKARMDLRRELVREECFKELGEAIERLEGFVQARCGTTEAIMARRDVSPGGVGMFRSLMANVADGIVDSIYVLIGMGGEMGLDLSEVWRRVHAANLAKEGGGKRADGKILKPEGWVAPDVEGAIFKDAK